MAVTLVTGATGFIGNHLTRKLVSDGHRVRCLVRAVSRTERLSDLDVELVEGRLGDPSSVARAVQGVERVYHLAGLTSATHRSRLMQVNGWGTWHVVHACAQQPDPPELVYVSSIAAAGPCGRCEVRTEQDPPRPISHYGHSKRAGEVAVEQFANRVPTTVVRPGIVFGELDRELLPMFWSIERLRLHAVAGYRSPRLSVIHVADLVELLVRAGTDGQRLADRSNSHSPAQGYYFACRPEYPDYLEFGRLLQQALGRRYVTYLLVPQPWPWLVGGVGDLLGRVRGRSISLNVDKMREALAESWACCCQAAQRDLAFQPQRSLVQQLRATANWYREHGWL